MTHHFEYSIGAVHMNNAKDSVEKMQQATPKEIGFSYDIEEFEIFSNNTRYGVLAIYSINAALETIVALTSREFGISQTRFAARVDTLISQGIITNLIAIDNLKNLRKKRNFITHWEENPTELLGTSSYLPIMFAETTPENETEDLISMLIPERINQYILDLTDLLDDIICQIDEEINMKLYYSLQQIKEERLVVGH